MDEAKLANLLDQALQLEADNEFEAAAAQYHSILDNTSPHSDNKNIEEIRLKAFEHITDLYSYYVSERNEEGLALTETYQQEATSYYHQRISLSRIGSYATHFGDNKRALSVYRAALQLVEENNDTHSLIRAYSDLASAYNSVGNLEEAARYYLQAIEMHNQGSGSLGGAANIWNRLGLVYHQQGEISKAIAAHERYLKYYQDIRPEDVQSNMTALNNLGEGYLMAYDHQTAHHFFQRGLDLATEGQYLAVTADLYRNQGVAYLYEGKYEAALENLHRALQMSEASTNASIIVQTLYSLALAEFAVDQDAKAFEHAQTLLRMAGSNRANTHYANAIHLVGMYYQKSGDLQTAEKYWQEATYLAHESKQRSLLWQLHAKLAEIAATPDLAQVHLRIAANILEQMMEGFDDPILQNTFKRAKPVHAVLSQVKLDN